MSIIQTKKHTTNFPNHKNNQSRINKKKHILHLMGQINSVVSICFTLQIVFKHKLVNLHFQLPEASESIINNFHCNSDATHPRIRDLQPTVSNLLQVQSVATLVWHTHTHTHSSLSLYSAPFRFVRNIFPSRTAALPSIHPHCPAASRTVSLCSAAAHAHLSGRASAIVRMPSAVTLPLPLSLPLALAIALALTHASYHCGCSSSSAAAAAAAAKFCACVIAYQNVCEEVRVSCRSSREQKVQIQSAIGPGDPRSPVHRRITVGQRANAHHVRLGAHP